MFELFELMTQNSSVFTFPCIGIRDILDITLVTFFLYKIISLVRDTRTWLLFRGVLLILMIAFISNVLQLHTTWWIISNTLTVGLVALIVVFQPELRKALEQLGRSGKFLSLNNSKSESLEINTIKEITKACTLMGKVCTGALIVIERDEQLSDVQSSGIPINATITSQLLINIFEKNTPLHDGAVLIRNNKILAATCILPLSNNLSISKELGTRHRAALGVSENTDAIVLVVSEETGSISYVDKGVINRHLDEFELTKILNATCVPHSSDTKNGLNKIIKKRRLYVDRTDS